MMEAVQPYAIANATLRERLEQAEAKAVRLQWLVKEAYEEGWGDGAKECNEGEAPEWEFSDACDFLAAATPKGTEAAREAEGGE